MSDQPLTAKQQADIARLKILNDDSEGEACLRQAIVEHYLYAHERVVEMRDALLAWQAGDRDPELKALIDDLQEEIEAEHYADFGVPLKPREGRPDPEV